MGKLRSYEWTQGIGGEPYQMGWGRMSINLSGVDHVEREVSRIGYKKGDEQDEYYKVNFIRCRRKEKGVIDAATRRMANTKLFFSGHNRKLLVQFRRNLPSNLMPQGAQKRPKPTGRRDRTGPDAGPRAQSLSNPLTMRVLCCALELECPMSKVRYRVEPRPRGETTPRRSIPASSCVSDSKRGCSVDAGLLVCALSSV